MSTKLAIIGATLCFGAAAGTGLFFIKPQPPMSSMDFSDYVRECRRNTRDEMKHCGAFRGCDNIPETKSCAIACGEAFDHREVPRDGRAVLDVCSRGCDGEDKKSCQALGEMITAR